MDNKGLFCDMWQRAKGFAGERLCEKLCIVELKTMDYIESIFLLRIMHKANLICEARSIKLNS